MTKSESLKRMVRTIKSDTRHITEIENDPCTSFWLKDALAKLDNRDPLDSLNDAKLLLEIQQARWEFVQRNEQEYVDGINK